MSRVIWVAVWVLVLLGAVACTKTMYVVQNPDGTYTEVEGTAPEKDKTTATVVDPMPDGLLQDPDETQLIDEDLVSLDIESSNDYLRVGDDGPFYLQVSVGAKEYQAADRAAMNLAVVLNRSGSMSGSKLSSVKAAATWLIDNLTPADRVAIVSYSTDVRLDGVAKLDSDGRDTLRRAIEQLQDGGGTYLSGGLEAGAMQVLEALDREHLNRVILLSDGNANEGITDINQLGQLADVYREKGITVTTMGVGLDYNEDLMEKVAVLGGGNYHFIESADAVAAVFDKEMNTLGNTVVRDAVVELELPEGVSVDQIYGYRYEQTGRDVKVYMNSVSSGEKKRLLVSLDVPKKSDGSKVVVAKGKLSYRNEAAGKDMNVDLPEVEVTYTKDDALVERGMNKPVVVKVETVRNAELQKEVYKQLDSGNRDAAQKLVKDRKAAAKATNSVVKSDELDTQIGAIEELEGLVEEVPEEAAEQQQYRESKKYKRSKKADKAKSSDAVLY